MAKQTQTDKPRIFISHAWEDKALVRRLEAELRAAGAEVWVDHIGIRGGDNLPKRISDALEWCNTLLLIWSDAACNSDWVELEWSNAIALKRAIIPCRLDTTPMPGILANKAYLDFRNAEQGVVQLLHALNLARQPIVPAVSDATEPVARVIHHQLIKKPKLVKPKPPQILPRAKPLDDLSVEDVQQMLKEKDFYDSRWNETGKGLRHEYEAIERQGQKLVIDHATGLMWQQSGSSNYLTYAEAEKYIRDLNNQRFGGYNDWRLPTLEEAMSLMEPKKHDDLFLDPVFDHKQWWIWTADKSSASSAWCVYFGLGSCGRSDLHDSSCVRGVR
jgi:hypothetical protein